MIIDVFPFFNEFDLLEGRLEYLYNKIDQFIIIESNKTFTCKDKPLNFQENKSRYAKYSDKITHLIYDNQDTQPPDAWHHYHAQLDYALTVLNAIEDNAWVLVGDLDEIPNLQTLSEMKFLVESKEYTLLQDMFFYNLNQKTIGPWSGTVLTRNSNIKKKRPSHFRQVRTHLQFIENGGWHLSYWGTPEKIRYKIENFSHQEFNDEKYKSLDAIKDKINTGMDLYARPEEKMVKVDRGSLHPDLMKYFGKYEVTI